MGFCNIAWQDFLDESSPPLYLYIYYKPEYIFYVHCLSLYLQLISLDHKLHSISISKLALIVIILLLHSKIHNIPFLNDFFLILYNIYLLKSEPLFEDACFMP